MSFHRHPGRRLDRVDELIILIMHAACMADISDDRCLTTCRSYPKSKVKHGNQSVFIVVSFFQTGVFAIVGVSALSARCVKDCKLHSFFRHI